MLVRRFIIMLTIGVAGPLVGSGVASLAAAELFPLARSSPRVVRRAPPLRAAPTHLSRLRPAHEPVGASSDALAQDCAESLTLVGVLAVRADPTRSVGAVRGPEGNRLVGVGQSLGDRRVRAVERRHLDLESADGSTCRLSYGRHDETTPRSSPGTGPMRPGHVPGSGEDARPAQDLRPGAAERLWNRGGPLAGVRLAPRLSGGRLTGATLGGVRPGSLLHLAGLRSGDVLETVDGARIDGPDVAMDAYARLIAGETVEIGVLRAGTRSTLRYRLDG